MDSLQLLNWEYTVLQAELLRVLYKIKDGEKKKLCVPDDV